MHAINMHTSGNRTARRAVWLLTIVAALLARPAAAQETTIRGSLAPGDKLLANGVLSDEHQVRVRAGTRLEVTLIKTAPLQAAVLLVSPASGVRQMGYEAKWTGERLVDLWTADITTTETITLIVSALAPPGRPGTSGDYTMVINAPGGGGSPAPAPAPRGGGSRPAPTASRTLRAGERVQGQLTATAPVLSDNSHYADYTYTARAGERITVTLASADFDAMLFVGAGSGLQDAVNDDDSGGGTNSRVEYTAPRAGPLTIRVNTLGPGETGAYTLALTSIGGGRTDGPQPRGPAPRVLRAGQRTQGELQNSDGRLADGSFYHDYTYTARRGERITVTLTSAAFDAFLHAGRPGAGTQLVNAVTDDDGAGGTNSRVRFVADRDGPVTIRVNTLTSGETGAYTLLLENVTRN